MTTSRMALKVPVSLLLANAEKARERLVKEHAAERKAYAGAKRKHERAMRAYRVAERDAVATDRKRLAAALTKRAQAVLRGQACSDGSTWDGGRYVQQLTTGSVKVAKTRHPSEPTAPYQPAAKPNTSAIDRDIRFLLASADDTLRISVDSNLARYL